MRGNSEAKTCQIIGKVLLILVLCSSHVFAVDCRGDKTEGDIVDAYLGRLVRASFRTPYAFPGRDIISSNVGSGETEEDVLTELVNDSEVWKQFSFEQKRELTFVALIYGKLEGGPLTMLLILLNKDATRISRDLNQIPDKTLNEEFNLDIKGVEYFRTQLRYLEGKV